MDTLVSRKPPSGAGLRKSKESKATHKALIANNLKKVYDEVAKEDLPPELQLLLNQLEEGGK
ncbi:MAG: NepR family anti-sigma factor [Terricaulis sp.]